MKKYWVLIELKRTAGSREFFERYGTVVETPYDLDTHEGIEAYMQQLDQESLAAPARYGICPYGKVLLNWRELKW